MQIRTAQRTHDDDDVRLMMKKTLFHLRYWAAELPRQEVVHTFGAEKKPNVQTLRMQCDANTIVILCGGPTMLPNVQQDPCIYYNTTSNNEQSMV